MKKLYLCSILIFIGCLSQAQINKGTVLLGGELGFSNSTQKNYTNGSPAQVPAFKFTYASIQPSAMIAIGKNVMWGFNLDFDYQAQPNSNYDMHYNEYGIGTFLRKYKPLGSGFYLFGQSALEFTYGDERSTYPPSTGPYSFTETKNAIISLGFSPGIAYAVNRKWQVELLLSGLFYADYANNKETDIAVNPTGPESTNVEKANGFDFGSNLSAGLTQLLLGVHYVIGSK